MRIYLVILLGIAIFSCTENKSSFEEKPEFQEFLAKQFPFTAADYTSKSVFMDEAKRKDENNQTRNDGIWKVQGPGNIGARVNCVKVDPQNPDIIVAGYSDGGLWISENGGMSWEPKFDQQTEMSIGSIAFHPVQANTLLVGTGDPNISGYPKIGNGIFKSSDLGENWTYLGLKECRIISNIIFSKNNPNIIYASAMGNPLKSDDNRGMYKSIDGGISWQNILFINDKTGISDFVVHPSNDSIIYAISWTRIRTNQTSIISSDEADVWRTVDGGDNWQKLENGLPDGVFSRLGIDISQSNPKVLYVSYTNANTLNVDGIYTTKDGGDIWTSINIDEETGFRKNMLGGFGWYFGKLKINPKDENDIFMLGVDLFRGNMVTNKWELGAPEWYTYEVHADKHDLIFMGDKMFLATDGGLYRADVSASPEWVDIENIPTTQFYRTAYNPHIPELYYGGAQDNGTSSGNESILNEWERIFGGDGFQPAFHPTNPDIMYVETQTGGLNVSTDGGFTFEYAANNLVGYRPWDMQYIISPHNPDILFAGTDVINRSVSGAIPNWVPISPSLINFNVPAFAHHINSLDQSAFDPNIIYCGTSDAQVWVTKNGGGKWDLITNGLPIRYVSSIKSSTQVIGNVYVTYTGYKDNDFTPKIYRSNDFGSTWQSISGDLPNLAINDVYVYPKAGDDILFVGTDGGVYFTIDAGLHWERLGNNMPYVPTYDMDFHVENNELIAATFGRGIQTFELSQVGIALETSIISQLDQPNMVVYPRITDSYVHCKLNKAQKLILTDRNGNTINTYNDQMDFEIDLSSYPAGIYLLMSASEVIKIMKL